LRALTTRIPATRRRRSSRELCGASATLLESELFGHVRGAFTGATGDGRFALAGRGTTFLDEIGDTSRASGKPLCGAAGARVRSRRRAPERTEARVITATNAIRTDAARRRISRRSRHRLRVVEIVVPPLSERADDIPLLARHLVHRASAAVGRPPPVLSRDALDVLMRYQWPGNVRELENCLTRAVMVATSDVIRADHVQVGDAHADLRAEETPLVSLESLERAHVERVLAATQGQKTRAAQILGVSRPRLDRLLHKHGLE
jgi:DNA-binding NtrC family response regulator